MVQAAGISINRPEHHLEAGNGGGLGLERLEAQPDTKGQEPS